MIGALWGAYYDNASFPQARCMGWAVRVLRVPWKKRKRQTKYNRAVKLIKQRGTRTEGGRDGN